MLSASSYEPLDRSLSFGVTSVCVNPNYPPPAITPAINALIRLLISTAIVVTLAVLSLWNWAYLILGLCILGEATTASVLIRRGQDREGLK